MSNELLSVNHTTSFSTSRQLRPYRDQPGDKGLIMFGCPLDNAEAVASVEGISALALRPWCCSSLTVCSCVSADVSSDASGVAGVRVTFHDTPSCPASSACNARHAAGIPVSFWFYDEASSCNQPWVTGIPYCVERFGVRRDRYARIQG